MYGTEIFVILLSVFIVLYLVWHLLLADADLILSLAELFGRSVSVYREKVVWVTGASSGLGEAMAYELASVGAKLILTSRNNSLLEKVKNKCLELAQGKLNEYDILILPFDITDQDVHQVKVMDALNHFGQIDVLINNAGRFQLGPTINTDSEVDKEIFEINFFAGISLTKRVLSHFLYKGSGHIVVVSSAAGKIALPMAATYTATKHALHGYYEALRMEHYHDCIDVTVVCPGAFQSDLAYNVMSTKKGEIWEDLVPMRCEMPTSRCAHLTLLAAANKLDEAWISYQPILFGMVYQQYFPGILRHICLSVVFTPKDLKVLSEGRCPSIPMWKPFFR